MHSIALREEGWPVYQLRSPAVLARLRIYPLHSGSVRISLIDADQ